MEYDPECGLSLQALCNGLDSSSYPSSIEGWLTYLAELSGLQ